MSRYKNKYDQEGVELGLDWVKNRAIIKCKNGHIFSFAHFSQLTEWGHPMGAFCEGCNQGIHAMELEFIKYDTKEEWTATGLEKKLTQNLLTQKDVQGLGPGEIRKIDQRVIERIYNEETGPWYKDLTRKNKERMKEEK